MKIERNVALFNIACNIVASMKQQKGLSAEDLGILVQYIQSVKDSEFPEPEPQSPIITPTAAEVAEVSK